MTELNEPTLLQRIKKLSEKRQDSASRAERILENYSCDIPRGLSNLNGDIRNSTVVVDPVYHKLLEEVRLIKSSQPLGYPVSEDWQFEHFISLTCVLLGEMIVRRQMDERTYNFILENSPQTIVKRLYYNNWRI